MFDLSIRGVGYWSPGMPHWADARRVINEGAPWPVATPGRPTPALMPANDRRRAPDSVLLALCVAEQACAEAAVDPAAAASVFVSMFGDLAINDYMCAALAQPEPLLSPTRFHNSVHNAPSGYWSIATGATLPTTSIAAGRASFAAGLLETASQVADTGQPMLLVAYDVAGVGPMAEVAGCTAPFGCAFVIDAPRAGAMAITLDLVDAPARADCATVPGLVALAGENPIAEAAGALLETLAMPVSRSIVLAFNPDLQLRLQLRP